MIEGARTARWRARPLCAVLVLLALGGCTRAPRPRFQRVLAPPCSRITLELEGGRTHELVAKAKRWGTVPVLHVWDVEAAREAARAGGMWGLGRRARAVFRVSAGAKRRYELLVTAPSAARSGTVDVTLDGAPLAERVHAGGLALGVQLQRGAVYQAASTPGGTRAALLLGLDRDGALLGWDASSGPTGLPRLAHADGMRRLVVGSVESHPGAVRVYTNDPIDADADGLGRDLENALGTCDSPSARGCRDSALSRYYETVPNATRDSDRDGLPDAAEIFGVSASALDLPRYGVEVRHKDVLVELDHRAPLPDVGFTERELAQVAALYAQGSADALRNLDGQPGVSLHFDAGFAPADSGHGALLGDFGGSNASRARDYHAARRSDFTPERAGYFRYVFVNREGRGQARGDALTVNRDLPQRVAILAHELGHTLGLAHHGHDSWGEANCKPSYFSIMNYVYQNELSVGFSRRHADAMNPLAVFEGMRVSAANRRVLRAPPFELDVYGGAVDWNRDGLISEEPVRAGLTWATYKSCAAAEQGQVVLAEPAGVAATPVLLRSGERLHALWLGPQGEPTLRSTGSGPIDGSAQCSAPEVCAPWSEAQTIPAITGWRALAAHPLDAEHWLLAGVDASGALQLRRLDPQSLQSEPLLQDSAAQTADTPAFAHAQVSESYYGAHELLMLVARDAQSGRLVQWTFLPDGSFGARRWLLDGAQRPIETKLGPSLLTLPSGELCGAFPDRQGFVRFYCYDKPRDLWIDLTARVFDAALGPQTTAPVSMAYHRYRDAAGHVLDASQRGAIYLSFAEPDTSVSKRTDNPHFFVSEWLSAEHGAREQLHFRWRGRVLTEWTNLEAGAGLALYADAGLPSLKALALLRGRDKTRLVFLPFADGASAIELGTGDDFEVMERGICVGLHGQDRCGDASTGRY